MDTFEQAAIMDSATWRHMKNNEEVTGMKMGDMFEDNSTRRQKEINGQVVETVDLRVFEKIKPGITAKGTYDVLTVVPYLAFYFDVDLTAAALVNKAITAALKVYATAKSGDTSMRIDSTAFETDWVENAITYNNRPGLFAGMLPSIIQLSALSVGWNTLPVLTRKDADYSPLRHGFVLRFDPQDSADSNTSLTMYTRRGTYPPVLEITATQVPLAISNRLPSGGFVYAGADKVFSWSTAASSYDGDLLGAITQASAKLRYRLVGAGSYTEISISGATNAYTIPADTFDGGENYEWQVAVTSNDGVETVSSWIQFTTEDATPDKPTLISPANEYVETDAPVTFEWQHNINTGTPQSAADLQYSYDGGAWTDIDSVSGSENTYTAVANTLPAGSLRWRARTYNTDDVAGEWSDPIGFGGVGSPAAAVISDVPTASRPTFGWQSVGQMGYQLRLLDDSGALLYDTGETAGAGKTLTLPLYLANGDYTVQLRIINASQLWSDWVEVGFALDVTPPDTPTVTAEAITDGARVTISGVDADAAHVYLLRDGAVIAELTGATYDDYAALSNVEYTARVVDSNENYADSAPAAVTVTLLGAVVATVDALSDVVRMRQKASGQPAVTSQAQLTGGSNFYAGREYPLYTFSEFTNESFSPAYFYTTRAEWAALETLIKRRQTVLYRDMMGNRVYGVVSAYTTSQDEQQVSFVLTLQRVDYVEEIEYAEAGA